ncbi:MAG TPA: 6-hydroxymethylpterin diphosphokinase MptE-like protein [Polyangiaceae bacterium]|nr:6-hydroxymethylpterin diphosphokinase MptE-like protein [Polyangiaceae bacterium]
MISAELAARFLEHNLGDARLSEELKTLVRGATRSAQIVETEAGLLGLTERGQLFATAHQELALFEIAKRATDDATLVIFGLGVGHTVRQLRALTAARLAVFEPDPGIVRTHFESGPSDLRDVPIVCSIHELNQLWTRLSHANQSVTLVVTPGYSQLFPEQAKELGEALSQLVQRNNINDATHRLRARVWIQDLLANVDLLAEHPSFLALAGKYRGVPAFIVGAGPSLGKNGKLLADAAQKGIVFAVNSSARALASYGVEPQVLACMESIDVSHLLEEVPYLDRVVRAFSLTAHPRTLRTGSGPLLPVFEGIPQVGGPMQVLLGFQGLPVAGSVSTLAFSLAQRLGCSPIVLVGQDLAYTDGQTYAPGSPYAESRARRSADGEHLELDWSDALKQTHNHGTHKMREREPLRETAAWGGTGTVYSTLGFTAVRGWFEFASIVLADECPELRLVNATEGGARITGFEEQSLADVLADLPIRRITARELSEAARHAAPPLSIERIRSWCHEYAGLARDVRQAARRIRRLTEVALSALKAGNAPQVVRNFSKLEHAELALRRAVARIPFVDAWAHAAIEPENKPPAQLSADDQENARRSVTREQHIASAIETAARELETELELVRRALRPEPVHAPDEVESATM